MNYQPHLTSVSFDARSHRFEGLVAFPCADGSSHLVRAAVIGTRRWPFERVMRELVRAARAQPSADRLAS